MSVANPPAINTTVPALATQARVVQTDKSNQDRIKSNMAINVKFKKGDETYSNNINLINEQITIWENLGLDLNSDIESFNRVFEQMFQLNHVHKNPFNFGSFKMEKLGSDDDLDPVVFKCSGCDGPVRIYHFDKDYTSAEGRLRGAMGPAAEPDLDPDPEADLDLDPDHSLYEQI